MTKIDFSGLKQKLMTSIVAISAIQVLKAFMNVEQAADTTKLAWLVGVHLVFVTSMLMPRRVRPSGGRRDVEGAPRRRTEGRR